MWSIVPIKLRKDSRVLQECETRKR